MGETFLGALLNNLMVLLPFVIIRSYQKGVRWHFGKDPVLLEPGFHWKMWLYHQVEIVDVVDEVLTLQHQSVITKDEKLVCFSVNIAFRVSDAVQHFCSVHDFIHSTAGVAMAHLSKRIRSLTLADLVNDTNKVEKSLETTLATKLKVWGTEVISVGFVDFAEVPQQMRIFSDMQNLIPVPHG